MTKTKKKNRKDSKGKVLRTELRHWAILAVSLSVNLARNLSCV